MFYLYNPATDLYYQISGSIEVGTGLVTISVSQDGIATNPGYVPAEGEVICPIEYYVALFKLDPATVDGNRYLQIAQSVTRYVERYCNETWVDETVPEDLLYLTACMIRDRYNEADKNKDPRFQSESVKNYSYTVNAQFLTSSLMAKYNTELDMFRHVAFL